MGRADVGLKYLGDKQPQRFRLELTNQDGNVEATPFGHLDVVVRWRFNPNLPLNFELVEDNDAKANGGSEEESDDGEDPVGEESEEAKAKAAEDAKKALESAENSTKVVSGDYTLYVHVIEARDLKAKDLSGTSDPVVYVEFLDKKVNTAIVPATLSPVWDDSFTLRSVATLPHILGWVRPQIARCCASWFRRRKRLRACCRYTHVASPACRAPRWPSLSATAIWTRTISRRGWSRFRCSTRIR
jgi:hypothetical protein